MTKEPEFHLLILASHSEGRRQLLERLKIPFFQIVIDVDEKEIIQSLQDVNPFQIPIILAREKNNIAREQLKQKGLRYRYLLTADTVILTEDGSVIGKPCDENQALHVLRQLRGKTHQVISSCVIWDSISKSQVEKSSTAHVTFREFSEKALNLYVQSQEPLGKAGAYAIQGAGSFLIQRVEGSIATVIGLPLEEMMELLLDIKNQGSLRSMS